MISLMIQWIVLGIIELPILRYGRRKFRSQTSDNIWAAGQEEVGRDREEKGRKKIREKKAKHYVFPSFWGSGGSKVGSLKRQVRSHLVKWEMKKCTLLWRQTHFQVNNTYKTHHSRSTLGSWNVEKEYAVVARSAFRSQNVQNTPFQEHCWKRCSKSARHCGAKHVWKPQC